MSAGNVSVELAWGPWKDMDPSSVAVCNLIKAEVQQKIGNSYPVYLPLNIRPEATNGLHFEFKVYVGKNKFAYIKAYSQNKTTADVENITLVTLPDVDFI